VGAVLCFFFASMLRHNERKPGDEDRKHASSRCTSRGFRIKKSLLDAGFPVLPAMYLNPELTLCTYSQMLSPSVQCFLKRYNRAPKDEEMLKSWSIKNFKPIVDSGELQLAPVTVLAGRNSSGKSSLLQSILMIAQTLGSRLLDRPLLPNERLVQLGTFEDILSEIVHSHILEIKFGLEIADEEIFSSPRLRPISSRWNILSARFSVKFSGATGNGTTSSAIKASKVIVEHASLEADAELKALTSLTTPGVRSRKVSFDLQKMGEGDMQRFLENVSPEQQRLIRLV
jgi:hypothetical protein